MHNNADTILQFKHVCKRFPGVTALNDVSFAVQRGTIHGLCGENGAGKSTLMKILSGIYPHGSYEGSILYNNEELVLQKSSISQSRNMGISIVHQELALLPNMTVGENIYLGWEPITRKVINWNKLYADAKRVLQQYQLHVSPFERISDLSVGQQQMVEIAKSLAGDAQILILDEPTSALPEREVAQLLEIVRSLASRQVTCIYITHKLEELFQITDNITILRDGEMIQTSPTTELNTSKLISYMVGREMKERFPKIDRSPGDAILEVQNLRVAENRRSDSFIVKDASFNLRRGEVLGIAGLMGSGRTELVMSIYGEMGHIVGGSIRMNQKDIDIHSSRDALRNGISLVPEDRKAEGLILMQNILQNISLPNLHLFSKFLYIDGHKELDAAQKFAKRLTIKAPNLHVLVNHLSGGNQQKVVISKWLMSQPSILILDDPTRGIDVGAKYEIYKLMNELTETGVSVIMISSDLEEILGMCDRVLVLHARKTVAILDKKDAGQETIMRYATGLEYNKT